jgi:hypothetical protein
VARGGAIEKRQEAVNRPISASSSRKYIFNVDFLAYLSACKKAILMQKLNLLLLLKRGHTKR